MKKFYVPALFLIIELFAFVYYNMFYITIIACVYMFFETLKYLTKTLRKKESSNKLDLTGIFDKANTVRKTTKIKPSEPVQHYEQENMSEQQELKPKKRNKGWLMVLIALIIPPVLFYYLTLIFFYITIIICATLLFNYVKYLKRFNDYKNKKVKLSNYEKACNRLAWQ